MADEQEQNRGEAPTPFKLQKAREKGSVARSLELGFVGGLIAFSAFAAISGAAFVRSLAQTMRIALTSGIAEAAEPETARGAVASVYWSALGPLFLLGATVGIIALFLELVQLRGFLFTTQPLKPDLSRLNPAKGLKRLFSLRMLKETLKSIAKLAAFCVATWLVIRFCISHYGQVASDGERLPRTLAAATTRLIYVFLLVAAAFALLDQLLVRGEFLKQMRMSRREVTKEARDREGEPRIKQRRKQLHRELAAVGKGVGAVAGSDMLIVNPEHYAIALRYDEKRMNAPEVSAKGRNMHALRLKAEAFRCGVPVIVRPTLARALFRACAPGAAIPPDRYEAVAELYTAQQRARDARQAS